MFVDDVCSFMHSHTSKQLVQLPNKVNCVVHWNSYVPSGLVLNHGFGIMPSCFTHLCGLDDMWSMWIIASCLLYQLDVLPY